MAWALAALWAQSDQLLEAPAHQNASVPMWPWPTAMMRNARGCVAGAGQPLEAELKGILRVDAAALRTVLQRPYRAAHFIRSFRSAAGCRQRDRPAAGPVQTRGLKRRCSMSQQLPENCRQRLQADGKAYPKSNCAECGQFSPRWKECDAALAAAPVPPAGDVEVLVRRYALLIGLPQANGSTQSRKALTGHAKTSEFIAI